LSKAKMVKVKSIKMQWKSLIIREQEGLKSIYSL